MKLVDINVAVCPICRDDDATVDVYVMKNGTIRLSCCCGFAYTIDGITARFDDDNEE